MASDNPAFPSQTRLLDEPALIWCCNDSEASGGTMHKFSACLLIMSILLAGASGCAVKARGSYSIEHKTKRSGNFITLSLHTANPLVS